MNPANLKRQWTVTGTCESADLAPGLRLIVEPGRRGWFTWDVETADDCGSLIFGEADTADQAKANAVEAAREWLTVALAALGDSE